MSQIKVSVIIPVYNVEKYIRECVESVLNQTLDNIEIIIVNDGTKDNSMEVIQDLCEENNNIIVINKENGGLSSARNEGLKYARGEYISFIDSDDYIESNFLEILYDRAKSEDLDITYCSYTRLYEDDRIEKRKRKDILYDKCMSGVDFLYNQLVNEDYFETAWSGIYKAKFFNEENIRFYENILHEDVDFTPKVLLVAEKVKLINNYGYIYRERENSITYGKIHYDRVFPITIIINEFIKIYNETNDSSTRECMSILIVNLLNRILSSMRFIDNKDENQLLYQNIDKSSIIKVIRKNKYIDCTKIITNLFKLYLFKSSPSTFEIVKRNYTTLKTRYLKITEYINKYKVNKQRGIRLISMIKSAIIRLIGSENIDKMKYAISGIYSIKFFRLKNKKKIFYMLIPQHGNLGDQGIAYASKLYLKNKFKEYEVIEVYKDDTYKYSKAIKNVINEDDLIILHGGGNMGNLYIGEELPRRHIIKNFKDNKIISFTQTISFTSDIEGRNELNKMIDIYNNHPDLTLIAREEKSYEVMKKEFFNNKIIKCPDIVFYLNNKLNDTNIKRENIMTCLRADKECYMGQNIKQELIHNIKNTYEKVIISDTLIRKRVLKEEREEILQSLWNQFYSSKVVITDRLHGMIFCAITKTPCIVTRSLDHKIVESYKWIKKLNYIRMVDDLSFENIKPIIDELSNLKHIDEFDFDTLYFDRLYYDIMETDESFEREVV